MSSSSIIEQIELAMSGAMELAARFDDSLKSWKSLNSKYETHLEIVQENTRFWNNVRDLMMQRAMLSLWLFACDQDGNASSVAWLINFISSNRDFFDEKAVKDRIHRHWDGPADVETTKWLNSIAEKQWISDDRLSEIQSEWAMHSETIRHLHIWRSNYFAHANRAVITGKQKLSHKYPLTIPMMESLFEAGSKIWGYATLAFDGRETAFGVATSVPYEIDEIFESLVNSAMPNPR